MYRITILLLALLTMAVRAAPAWNYVGVPYPDWEYDPFTHKAPVAPPEWPSAEHSGWYFIAPDDPNASDSSDAKDTKDANNKRWGYPSRPRLTLPLANKNTNSFPAGTVFWLKGGTYDRAVGTGKIMSLSCLSTPENPFWIYGDPQDKPTFTAAQIRFYNSSYGFVENINWDATVENVSCVSFGHYQEEGQTHHIALRNLRIENRDFYSNGSYISIYAPKGPTDGDIHDIVSYKITFKNCGAGTDWDLPDNDPDCHGYKINGYWEWTYPNGVPTEGEGNRAYRIWVIENNVELGESPDPIDGYYKSLPGNFLQIGDQNVTQGNCDHVWVAGNVTEGTRQAPVGIKRCADFILSSNRFNGLAKSRNSLGAAFTSKYDRQDHLWFLNNFSQGTDGGYIRGEVTSSGAGGKDTFNPSDTRVYLVGNIFTDMMRSELGSNWRLQGIALHGMDGKVYIVNNIVHNSVYGVYWSYTASRQSAKSELHIYNNIFSDIHNTGIDQLGGVPIYLNSRTGTGDGGMRVFTENNLFDKFRVFDSGIYYETSAVWNNNPENPGTEPLQVAAVNAGNFQADPMFMNKSAHDFRLKKGSPAIDAGVYTPKTNDSVNVYQQFIDRYTGDPDFPGNPREVWPKGWLNTPRIRGASIDIGPYEFNDVENPGGEVGNVSKTTGLEVRPAEKDDKSK
jgi:hypothetical protein